MISQNDLYDLEFSLICIRNDIKYKFNQEILSKIIFVLKETDTIFEDNQIRKALASIKGLDQKRWYYVYHNNVYVNRRFLKNKLIYQLFIKLCEELNNILKNNNYEKAYDLVDSFHCLPNIIAENNFIRKLQ